MTWIWWWLWPLRAVKWSSHCKCSWREKINGSGSTSAVLWPGDPKRGYRVSADELPENWTRTITLSISPTFCSAGTLDHLLPILIYCLVKKKKNLLQNSTGSAPSTKTSEWNAGHKDCPRIPAPIMAAATIPRIQHATTDSIVSFEKFDFFILFFFKWVCKALLFVSVLASLPACSLDGHFVFAVERTEMDPPMRPRSLAVRNRPRCVPVLTTTDVAVFKIHVTDCGVKTKVAHFPWLQTCQSGAVWLYYISSCRRRQTLDCVILKVFFPPTSENTGCHLADKVTPPDLFYLFF